MNKRAGSTSLGEDIQKRIRFGYIQRSTFQVRKGEGGEPGGSSASSHSVKAEKSS